MSITIRRAGIERLDALAPLWAGMQAHHEAVAPAALIAEVAQFRDPADSWQRRRASYASWCDAGTGVLHIAEEADAVLAGNDAAARLYARHGMQPILTHMIGRGPPGP